MIVNIATVFHWSLSDIYSLDAEDFCYYNAAAESRGAVNTASRRP